jgi:hypothetical protein
MTMTERVRAELDDSFGGEPGDRPVEHWLDQGHRALRRRRAIGALAACGVVAVLGATYAVGGSSDTARDADRVVATDPTPSAGESTGATPRWEDDTPIQYLEGRLYIRPGVVVHERVENPLGYRSPRTSDALDLTYQGQRTWIITDADEDGFGYASSTPGEGGTSFRAWVDQQVSLGGAGPETSGPRTLRLTADGRVMPTAGTEVVQRTDDPRLGAGFAPAGATTGAAVVRTGDGTSYFVVWRVLEGKLDVITTPPSDVVGATFPELLTMARSQYASGEGLR